MQWIDIDEIAQALEDLYPDTDVENIAFPHLHELVTSLLDFEDFPSRSNERILEAIQAAWLTTRNEKDEF